MDNILKPIENQEQITMDWLKSLLSLHFMGPITNIRYNYMTPRKGEGFLSEISYVSVSFNDGSEGHDLSLVFKFLPNDAAAKKLTLDGDLPKREVSFYNFAKLKEFDDICQEYSVKNLIPKVYFAALSDSALTIVLEDMNVKNFKTIIPRDGANLKQTKEMLSRIAFIHAASLILYEKNGSFGVERHEDYSFFNLYFIPNLELLCKMYSGTPLGETFEQMTPFARKIPFLHLSNPIFETMIHGDLWIGQCMCSPDGEICILDWQFSTVATPIFDLMSFFFMSCDPAVLENDLIEILDCYWQQFSLVLKRNKIICPATFEEFVQSVERNWLSGFMKLITALKGLLSCDFLTEARVSGMMNFLNHRGVFKDFLKSCAQ